MVDGLHNASSAEPIATAASRPIILHDENAIVQCIIDRVGKRIKLGAPLGIGKANSVINALYRRAKSDPDILLTIMTALTLERPKGKQLLETRFLDPLAERIFGDYPDLDYEIDRVRNRLPDNVRVIEFYFPAGKFLHNRQAQQDYISSNYTHVARDLMDRGINVIAQLIAPGKVAGIPCMSLSSNPDISLDLMRFMRHHEKQDGTPCAIVGQVNPNLPFMYGDAVVQNRDFDFILDAPESYFKIFGPPKQSVPPRDHMIGLYLSTLIRDNGELQVGIGALGDAFVNALILRHTDNSTYRQVLQTFDVEEKFGLEIRQIGAVDPFDRGLFGASEMVVDGFLHLYRAGILKRVVYDDLPIQRLINEGLIDHSVTLQTLDLLLKRKAVHLHLSEDDFDYLVDFGIFREGLHFEEGMVVTPNGLRIKADLSQPENRQLIAQHVLGDRLKKGAIIHGGFFLGPQDFYEGLKAMPEAERQLFNMRSVRRINQLYGHEAIDRLQRQNARFVNSCMMVTLSGGIVSDGLEDGRVVSGVGGQYNFVAMAHALPDGRSLINLRATRIEGSRVRSNIVWNYGHITIPRHLRDVVVTEYGIANLRGKTDSEIIEALLRITDSRFQDDLMRTAKKAGKLRPDYQIPEAFRNNYPQVYLDKIEALKTEGLFPAFPFGTELTEPEQVLGLALKRLKQNAQTPASRIKLLLASLFTSSRSPVYRPYLERMGLHQVQNTQEWIARKLLVHALRAIIVQSHLDERRSP